MASCIFSASLILLLILSVRYKKVEAEDCGEIYKVSMKTQTFHDSPLTFETYFYDRFRLNLQKRTCAMFMRRSSRVLLQCAFKFNMPIASVKLETLKRERRAFTITAGKSKEDHLEKRIDKDSEERKFGKSIHKICRKTN